MTDTAYSRTGFASCGRSALGLQDGPIGASVLVNELQESLLETSCGLLGRGNMRLATSREHLADQYQERGTRRRCKRRNAAPGRDSVLW